MLAQPAQTSRQMPRDLRNLRKRQSIFRGTCAACANVSANAAELAQPAQTPKHSPRDLRGLRKCLGKCRETCATCANVSANAAEPSATCANVSANAAELAETPASIPQKRLDRYEASIDTLPAFFHRTHVANEVPEMADLDRDSDTPTT